METINFEEELVSLGLAMKSINTIKKARKSPRLPIKIGEYFWATVTNFTRKGGIHLLDVRCKPQLDYIRQYLMDKFKDTKPTANDLSCVPGDLCIAKYINLLQSVVIICVNYLYDTTQMQFTLVPRRR